MVTDTAKNIIKYLETRKQATVKELGDFLGISRQALHRQLLKLAGQEKLLKYGKPPKVFYQVKENSAVQYTVAPVLSIEQVKRLSESVFRRYKINRAGVFGSVARGSANEKSDVDILVDMDLSYDLFDFLKFKQELESVLKKRVDLLEYRAIKPVLRENILNSEVVIYEP